MTLLKEFGNRLRALREERGWTQQEAAERLGIPRTSYSGYENGSREADFATVVRMARLYEVSVDYLLGVSTDRTATDEHLLVIGRKLSQLSEEDKQTLIAIIDAYLGARRRRQAHDSDREGFAESSFSSCQVGGTANRCVAGRISC